MARETEIDLKKDWKLIDKKLSEVFYQGHEVLKLKIGTDILIFRVHIIKNKVGYIPFLNNELYISDINNKYMNILEKYIFPLKEREKYKKSLCKIYGKKRGMKEFENSAWNNKLTYYKVYFNSKLAIKKMLKRQTEKIILIEEI